MVSKHIVIFLAIFGYCISADIPSYIKACKLSDPSFETCALSVTRDILEQFKKGATALQSEALTVSKLPVVVFAYGDDFIFRLRDAAGYGLDTLSAAQIKKVPNENTITASFTADKIEVGSHLYINANINNRQIVNHGLGNMTFHGVELKLTFSWQPKKGKPFTTTEIVKANSEFIMDSISFNIDFANVDHETGSKLNEFLTGNSKEIIRKITPSLGAYLDNFFIRQSEGFFNQIPHDKLFLE